MAAVKDVWRHADREWLRAGRQFSRHYLRGLPDISKALNIFFSLYAQEYTGAINVTPSFRLVEPRKILGHLQAEEIEALYLDGRQSTWARVEQIRLSTQIGRTLDDILDRHRDHDVRKFYR